MGLLDFITGSDQNQNGQGQNPSDDSASGQPTLQPVPQASSGQPQPVAAPHNAIPKREIKQDHINPSIQNNMVNDYGTDTLAHGSGMQPIPTNDSNTPVATANTQITTPQTTAQQTQTPIEPFTPPPVQNIDETNIQTKDPNSLMSEMESADPVDQNDLSTGLPVQEQGIDNSIVQPPVEPVNANTEVQAGDGPSGTQEMQNQVQIGTEQAPAVQTQEAQPKVAQEVDSQTPESPEPEIGVEPVQDNIELTNQTNVPSQLGSQMEPTQGEQLNEMPPVTNQPQEQNVGEGQGLGMAGDIQSEQPDIPASTESVEMPQQQSTVEETPASNESPDTISQILEKQQQPNDSPGVLNIDTQEAQTKQVEQTQAENHEVGEQDLPESETNNNASPMGVTPEDDSPENTDQTPINTVAAGEQTSPVREPGQFLNLTKITLIGLDNLPSDQNEQLSNATAELLGSGYKLMMDTNEGGGGIVRAKALEVGSNVVSVINRSQMSEQNQDEQSGSKVLFSNYLDFVEYIVHESDAFVFIHPSSTQDIQLFSTMLHLAATYNERAKPMICVGFNWTDMVKTIVQTDNRPPVQTIRSLNDLPGSLTALQDIYKKSAANVTDEVIDLREQGDEQGLTAV